LFSRSRNGAGSFAGELPMMWRRGTLVAWSAAAAISAVPAPSVGAQFLEKPTRPQVQTPKGPVRQVIFKNCTSCHGIDDYAYNALDRSGWNALIESKHGKMHVLLGDHDRDLLLYWLRAKFGPTTTQFTRVSGLPE